MPRFAWHSGRAKTRCAPFNLSSLILRRQCRIGAATFAASWARVCIRLLLVAGATGAGIWQALKSVICRCALCHAESSITSLLHTVEHFFIFFTLARKSGPARGQSLEAQLLARIVRDLGEPFDQLGLHPLLTILDHVLHLEQGLQENEKQMHIPTSQTRFCGMRVPYCTLLCSRAGQPVFVAFSAHLETCSNTYGQANTDRRQRRHRRDEEGARIHQA